MNIEDYSKYYIQGSDHYLIHKNEFIELFNKRSNLKAENKNQIKKETLNSQIKFFRIWREESDKEFDELLDILNEAE